MVPVDRGSFVMGGEGGDADELPARTVHLSAFRIDAREVTAAQYDSCVRAGACTPAHYDDGACLVFSAPRFRAVTVPRQYRDPSYPVVCVSWGQAREYCRFKGGRLPTEAQWEYAATGGRTAAYAWGSDPPSADRCTPAARNCPSSAGSYRPDASGLYDMTGNVWEWTGDRYQADYYTAGPADDPQGPEVGRYRVIRGGGWYSGPSQLRLRNRHWFAPEAGEVSIGFRCVR